MTFTDEHFRILECQGASGIWNVTFSFHMDLDIRYMHAC